MSAQARIKFIEDYAAIAKAATAINRKVFPQTILTVAILESTGQRNGDWIPGGSKLSIDGKNYFGIKDSSQWNGKTITMETTEEINNPLYPPVLPERILMPTTATFRKYDSVEDSFNDFVKFLTDNPRYATNGVFEAKNPPEQFQALKRAGYATSSQYASLLNSIYVTMKPTLDKYFTGGTSSSLSPFAVILLGFLGYKLVSSQSK